MPHHDHDRCIQQGKANFFPVLIFQSLNSPEENVPIAHKSEVENGDWRLGRAEPEAAQAEAVCC